MMKRVIQTLLGKKNSSHKKFPRLYNQEQATYLATDIRKSIIQMILEAKSGHPAGALGMTDVFVALYFYVLKHDPARPSWQGRDWLILSNGHICPVLYATLSKTGYFPKSRLNTLRKIGSQLQGHPHYVSRNNSQHSDKEYSNLPGVENTSGPLGQGLSQAIGVALSFKIDRKPNSVYCVMSDGELQEGQNWESLMFAGSKKLNNLTVLIDRNKIQLSGFTKNILPLEPLKDKFESFNWHTIEINGHNTESIITACKQAKVARMKPTVIICNTVPGKGVSFMENLPQWHGQPPSKKQAEAAIKELTKS